MPYCFLVLGDGILEVLLVVKFVSMFLTNLSNNISWELRILRNLFSLSKKHFLHQSVDLHVVIHLI